MEQGAISLAADGTILYCNASFADLLKTPLERVIGAKLIAFVAPEDARTLRNATQKGRSDAARCVVKLVASGGVAIPSSLTITHLAGSSPPTWCVVVSELATKELAREAQHAREKAEAANAAKDDFLALLSHELRGPLNAILGWAQILLRLDPDDPELRKGLENIERNARSQARLISDLADTARIASGKLRLELQPVQLDEVARASVNAVLPAAQEKAIQIVGHFDCQCAVVFADPSRLQQIVTNLLTNAVKHTPPGGTIEISTVRRRSSVDVRVRDDGEGIPLDFLPRLFQPFQQAAATPASGEAGLGLGLAIVKRLAELHGGTVAGASDGPGTGSSFTVSLPLPLGR